MIWKIFKLALLKKNFTFDFFLNIQPSLVPHLRDTLHKMMIIWRTGDDKCESVILAGMVWARFTLADKEWNSNRAETVAGVRHGQSCWSWSNWQGGYRVARFDDGQWGWRGVGRGREKNSLSSRLPGSLVGRADVRKSILKLIEAYRVITTRWRRAPPWIRRAIYTDFPRSLESFMRSRKDGWTVFDPLWRAKNLYNCIDRTNERFCLS